jgi:hypothetical protein
MYAVYKSMKCVAHWWPQPVAECKAVNNKYCAMNWMWSLVYMYVAVTSEMLETTAKSALRYKPQDHNPYDKKYT